MTRTYSLMLVLFFFLLSIFSASVSGAGAKKQSISISNAEVAVERYAFRDTHISDAVKSPIATTQSLGYRAVAGIVNLGVTTSYDLGSNFSQQRQISVGCSGYIHAAFMEISPSNPTRVVTGASYVPGGFVNTSPVSDVGGGYPSMTTNGPAGLALAVYHRVAGGGTLAAIDFACGAMSMSTSFVYPDTVIGIVTGHSESDWYIWPQVTSDIDAGGNWFIHVVATETWSTDTSGYQSLVYWRSQDNSHQPSGTAATFIDSVTSITATVVAHPDQSDQRVAIVYNKPRVYGAVLYNNDNIVYRESTNLGATWGSVQSVYNYAANQDQIQSSTSPFFERGQENSALYASDGCLHVLFLSTWSDTGQTHPGWILIYPSKIYHWDNCNQCATLVSDVRATASNCQLGGSALRDVCKVNISECSGKLYAVFSKSLSNDYDPNLPLIHDCSLAGYANFEIIAKASSTSGLTWGPDSNLTNTATNACAPGACNSEIHLGTAERTTDSLRILYLEDKDAGISIFTNGSSTNNPVKVLSVGCFGMTLISELRVDPDSFSYPFNITPMTVKDTLITLTNVGNVTSPWSVSSGQGFISFPSGNSGSCPAGCSSTSSFLVRFTGPASEGFYSGSIDVTYSSPDKSKMSVISIPVELYNFTNFFLPQNAVIRTETNKICVNQTSEAGANQAGSMFSYFADQSNYLYDSYLIIGNDPLNLSYSVFDGAAGGQPTTSNPYGYLYAASPAMTVDSTGNSSYRIASGKGVNRDTTIGFSVDWYAPKHADSSDFYIGQFKLYKGSKNPTGSISNLSIAYFSDWDVPSDTGSDNTAGYDASRSMVWLRGTGSSTNLSRYAATAVYRNDGNDYVGAWALDGPIYIYPNNGFENDSLWSVMESLWQGMYRIYSGYQEDLHIGTLIYRDATINGAINDTLKFVTILAATRNGGISGLNVSVDRARDWICEHELITHYNVCSPAMCGDADGNTVITISDAVRILNYIFADAAAPPDPPAADADNSGCVDLADAVYLTNYIFFGGPAPGPACNLDGCSYSTVPNNRVRVDCPTNIPTIDPGDSIGINVYLTSTVELQGFSLGFTHNSPDLEFSSASRASVLSGMAYWSVKPIPANNQILVGTMQLSSQMLAPMSDVHCFTLYLKNVSGAQTQCINIDSAFVGPAGKFIFTPSLAGGAGAIAAQYEDCGLTDISINSGCGDPLANAPKYWSFPNSELAMWPQSWWQDFNYCDGISPCEQFCLLCSPSTFPDWNLFVSAVGEDWAYFDPPPGDVRFRPAAIAQWEAIRGAWTGSCFGFAATSFLFYDYHLQVGTEFPGYSDLRNVPLGSGSRELINKYYLYQFGNEQQQLMNQRMNTKTPSQTLGECISMLDTVPHNDRILMMFNQSGPGGHAVVPYRCLENGSDPTLWYIYVHDSNHPADTSKRIAIDLTGDAWEYSAQPGWGGNFGLFLLDEVGNYLEPLVLADTSEMNEDVTFYLGEADSAYVATALGSIGFGEDGMFGSLPGGFPIIPADGMETLPIGFYLPSGEYYLLASGVVDGVFTIVDGDERIFRNGGAKSGIISCYYVADYNAPSITSYGTSGKGAFDSSFIEIISMSADSEIVINISGLELAAGDSLTVTLTPTQSIQVDNYGGETSYDLQIQIVTPTEDTSFYSPDISLDSSSSQLIAPDWRPSGDTLIIAIDTSMTGSFDSTVVVPNQPPPQFLCGDADGNHAITVSDVVYLINYIFAGGAAPNPIFSGDADCNGIVTISDAVYLINYIFAGGAAPCSACI